MSERHSDLAEPSGADTALSLRGVRALCLPLPEVPSGLVGAPRGDVWLACAKSIETATEHARMLGATVTQLSGVEDYSAEMAVRGADAFVMHNESSITNGHRVELEAAFLGGEGRKIPRPGTETLASCDTAKLSERLRSSEPVMVALPEEDLGHCKYVINEPWQLERLLRFCADHPEENWPEALEVREVIRTPGEYFTSYRALVTATGKTLASGLIHSGHTKASGKLIVNDRPGQGRGRASVLKAAVEVPTSPYFIAAYDWRSNAAAGGEVIPLMGPALERGLTKEQAEIAADHGIDPLHPALPAGMAEMAALVGRKFGPHFDVVLGVDSIQDIDGTDYLLEWNTDPSASAYVACGYGDDPISALTAMRCKAVDTLKSWRQK